VNDLPYSPFGGEKNSGIGRFNGAWAVSAFTTDQWVTIQHKPRQYTFHARANMGRGREANQSNSTYVQ
jgi:aldehyde dehydrogenase (NAD+)